MIIKDLITGRIILSCETIRCGNAVLQIWTCQRTDIR